MKTRIISMADIAQHPVHSFSPRDYIFVVGETVIFTGEPHIVVRQEENDLWLAQVEYIPGSKTVFSCSVPSGPTTTIFAVKRPKPNR